MNAADREAFIGEVSRAIGWESCWFALRAAGEDTAREAARTVWRHPRFIEVEQRRRVDHEPCSLRSCRGRCSRCIHAAAWRRRGGRDYLGAAREAEIAAARGAA